MEDKVIEKVEGKIKEIIDSDINNSNIEYLYKLSKIKHMLKEEENMYNNYNGYNDYNGRGPGHGSYGYGNYNEYGRRGVDSKYRGYGHLDRMYNEYGNYSYGRERYGANEDTKKSLDYMLRSMEDFARMLKQEASSQEEVEMIRQTAQRIAQL